MRNKKYTTAIPSMVSLPSPEQGLLTVRETAAVLRRSPSTIRSWILHRRIPFVKLYNKAIRFRRADIDALIASSIIPACGKAGAA
jgi:excisionase family DNA binding protein